MSKLETKNLVKREPLLYCFEKVAFFVVENINVILYVNLRMQFDFDHIRKKNLVSRFCRFSLPNNLIFEMTLKLLIYNFLKGFNGMF